MSDTPPLPQTPADAARVLQFVETASQHIGRNVVGLGAVLRVIALVGLAAGVVVALAVLPWVVQLPAVGAAIGALVVVGIVALPPLSLLRHRRALVDVYGNEHLLRDELAAVGGSAGEAFRDLMAVEAAKPTGRLGRLRWAWSYLRQVRAIWEAGIGDRIQRLAEPIEPTRLARSGWCIVCAIVVSALALPSVVLSLLAWRFLG